MTSMAATAVQANANMGRPTWQQKLQDHCRLSQLQAPVFELVSDRRGGRTAWSSTVTIQGTKFAARYFYDGQFTNNAKEDAAEVALTVLLSRRLSSTATTLSGQLYAQNQTMTAYAGSSYA